jgi:hypothetical protein
VWSGIFAARYGEMLEHLHGHEELRPVSEGGVRVALGMEDYERLHGLSDSELDIRDDLAESLRGGLPLTGPEVTALHELLSKPVWRARSRGQSVCPPQGEFVLERLGTTSSPERTDVGYRYYAWVDA